MHCIYFHVYACIHFHAYTHILIYVRGASALAEFFSGGNKRKCESKKLVKGFEEKCEQSFICPEVSAPGIKKIFEGRKFS